MLHLPAPLLLLNALLVIILLLKVHLFAIDWSLVMVLLTLLNAKPVTIMVLVVLLFAIPLVIRLQDILVVGMVPFFLYFHAACKPLLLCANFLSMYC